MAKSRREEIVTPKELKAMADSFQCRAIVEKGKCREDLFSKLQQYPRFTIFLESGGKVDRGGKSNLEILN